MACGDHGGCSLKGLPEYARGGTPAVWSSVMMFFQTLLTGGYTYAYWLIARFCSSRQGANHLILVGLSLVVILAMGALWPSPIIPGAGWRQLSYPILFEPLLTLRSQG